MTAKKLDTGDVFPPLTLRLSDGKAIELPEDPGSKYKVILFYRGHW